jgi:hypothetical protein
VVVVLRAASGARHLWPRPKPSVCGVAHSDSASARQAAGGTESAVPRRGRGQRKVATLRAVIGEKVSVSPAHVPPGRGCRSLPAPVVPSVLSRVSANCCGSESSAFVWVGLSRMQTVVGATVVSVSELCRCRATSMWTRSCLPAPRSGARRRVGIGGICHWPVVQVATAPVARPWSPTGARDSRASE